VGQLKDLRKEAKRIDRLIEEVLNKPTQESKSGRSEIDPEHQRCFRGTDGNHQDFGGPPSRGSSSCRDRRIPLWNSPVSSQGSVPALVRRFFGDCIVLDMTDQTTHHYAAINVELRQMGNPIATNELWIAALCRQHGLALLSRDRHFNAVFWNPTGRLVSDLPRV